MAVLGLHPYLPTYKLWADKTGQDVEDDDMSEEMIAGVRLEPVVVDWYTDDTGIPTAPTGMWRSNSRPHAFANPDRLTAWGGLEVKTTNSRNREWRDDQPAEYAEGQCQWYMSVLGPEYHRWDLAVLINGSRFRVWRITAEPEAVGILHEHVERFWSYNVQLRVPPRVDASDRTAELLKRMWQRSTEQEEVEVPGLGALVAERRRLKSIVGDGEKALKQVENELRAALGAAELGAEGGVPLIALRNRQRSDIDRGRLRDEHPYVYGDVKKIITYRQFEEIS